MALKYEHGNMSLVYAAPQPRALDKSLPVPRGITPTVGEI